MKKSLFLGLMLAATATLTSAAPGFTSGLSAEDQKKAGLDRLSTEERAYLDELIAHAGKHAAKATESSKSSDHVTLQSGAKVEFAAVESQIDGSFTGWSGKAVFNLKNGQRWKLANTGSSYYCPPIENPKVTITSAGFGGYNMKIQDVPGKVRVVPVE